MGGERVPVADSALPETVNFAERFAKSDQFDRVFREGMALVERTAAYLDKEGRAEARKLKPPLSTTYATESMRLTSRLLEMASWLLVRRSIKAGEISASEAAAKRARIKLGGTGRPTHIGQFDALPDGLRELIVASFQLNDRIVQLDRALEGVAVDIANPVAQQMHQLETAFTGGPRLVVSR